MRNRSKRRLRLSPLREPVDQEFRARLPRRDHDLSLDGAFSQTILDTARDAIVCIDSKGLIKLFNRAAEGIFGYAADEVLEREVNLLVPSRSSGDYDGHVRSYQRTRIAKAIGRIHYVEGRRKSGDLFPIELSISRGRVGNDVLSTAIIRDVTDRKKSDEAIRNRGRQQAVVAKLGLLGLAGAGLSELMSQAVRLVAETLGVDFCQVLELTPDRSALRLCAGVGWKDGVVGHLTLEAGNDSQAGFTLSTNEPVIMENLATESRFKTLPLLHEHAVVSGMTVIIHDQDRPYGVLGVHTRERRDFTGDDEHFLQAVANVLATSIQRSKAEDQMQQLQKLAQQRERLADIGAIAAKVVHDLGNPVAAISMQAQLLLRRAARHPNASAESLTEWAKRIVSETQRLDDLVGDFKYFARQQRLDVTTIDLADFLRTLVGVWQPVAAERRIELSLEVPDGLPLLWADEGKMRRVLDNLVKNAVEAIDTGPGEIRIEVSLPKQGTVRISVRDSGPGISETIQLFRLFETTKPDGSGLGLPISKEIAHAHGGNLEAERLEPRGTIFHLELPLERHSPN